MRGAGWLALLLAGCRPAGVTPGVTGVTPGVTRGSAAGQGDGRPSPCGLVPAGCDLAGCLALLGWAGPACLHVLPLINRLYLFTNITIRLTISE
jgi:hypothetical protein